MPEEIRKFELSQRLFSISAILVSGILIFLAGQLLFNFKNLPENYPREITVSGQGRTFAKPDIAKVSAGVKTEGMKIQDIVKENTEKMNSILAEIKSLGVEEKDIQTSQYNLSPRYDWTDKGERIFRGYTLTNEISLKIRNFEKIGEILDKASEKGANLIGDLQFAIDEPERTREIARKEAIEKAKEKAKQIASQSGLKLGKLLNVYESYYPIQTPKYKEASVALGGGEFAAAPEIQPGQEEVQVDITLVYRVR